MRAAPKTLRNLSLLALALPASALAAPEAAPPVATAPATAAPTTVAPSTAPAWEWKSATGNQIFPAPLTLPPAGTLRLGELAPRFTLPDATGANQSTAALLGDEALFLLLLGEKSPITLDALTGAAAAKAETVGVATAAIGDKNLTGPRPIKVLRDTNRDLAAYVTQPTFLAVDRAGWLRVAEAMPKNDADNTKLRFLMSQTGDPTPVLEVGKPAPDFCFPDAGGQSRRVSSLRGQKNLLLTFFPKCFTGKCKTHLSSLRDAFPGFLATKTEVWAVSVDPASGERGQVAFAASLDLPFPLLPDVGRNICILYGAAQSSNQLALRQSVLIDRDGIVRWIDRGIVPDSHGADMLAKIEELHLGPQSVKP